MRLIVIEGEMAGPSPGEGPCVSGGSLCVGCVIGASSVRLFSPRLATDKAGHHPADARAEGLT